MDEREASARASDPETSHDAAASIGHKTLLMSQAAVYLLFSEHGKMSDSELIAMARHEGLPQSESGLRTRRNELVKMGLLRDSGEKQQLPSGRLSIVWEIAPVETIAKAL